jgi:Ca2+-binding RTX toxin-like protein
LHGRGGDDALVGGPGADWMDGGPGNDTYEVDDSITGGGLGGGNRIALFYGDQVVETPDGGWDAVWASVDFALPGHVEGLVLTGSARKGYGNEGSNLIVGNGGDNLLAGFGGDDEMRGGGGDDIYLVGGRSDRVVEDEGQGTDEVWAAVDYGLPANVETLFLDGEAAAWGSGNALDNRIVGNDLDNRLVGWEGDDTLTGGAGDDIFYAMMTTSSRSTVTDFSPGADSGDVLAFSRDLFASREQACAASWQVGSDVWVVRAYAQTVVLLNTRVADLALDDFLVA